MKRSKTPDTLKRIAKFRGEELLEVNGEFRLRTRVGIRPISIVNAFEWYLKRSKAQPAALFMLVLGTLRASLSDSDAVRQFRELIAH